jgi:hypothetical protein
MKNLIKLFSFAAAAGFLLTSCEGPMGPAGKDANENCTLCHNSDAVLETRMEQWSESLHATGENAAYANRDGCVQCHTSQGFLQAVETGSTTGLTIPEEPQQINCYTCHKIHDSFTDEDWALTKPTAENLILKYKTQTIVWDKGSSNQCSACHQARDVSPAPSENGADFAITNSRIGVHHAPNTNLILGKIPFELTGTAYPTSNSHSTADGCITCHMAKPYGYMAGGHNMGMTYDSHGTETLLTTGCTACHSDAASLKTAITNLETLINTKLATLQAQLTTAGIYNASTALAKTGTFKANAVLAYLNYNAIAEDRSYGIHNPAYTKVLLDNSIAAMTALGY